MLRRKLQAAGLQALKQCVGVGGVTLAIRGGPLRGCKWRFEARTNNEIILGIFEPNMQAIYARYLRDGHVVFDLGAHQGFLAMLAAKLVGERGAVHAFEASPANFTKLEGNLRLNGVRNCRPVHAAVSDRNGSVQFSASIHDMGNTYLPSSPYFVNQPAVEVRTLTLDDYVRRERAELPDFVKIDVEGAEFDALRGAETLLTSKRPVLYLETHNVHNPGVDGRCLQYLAAMGYRIGEVIDQTPDNSTASYVLST